MEPLTKNVIDRIGLTEVINKIIERDYNKSLSILPFCKGKTRDDLEAEFKAIKENVIVKFVGTNDWKWMLNVEFVSEIFINSERIEYFYNRNRDNLTIVFPKSYVPYYSIEPY